MHDARSIALTILIQRRRDDPRYHWYNRRGRSPDVREKDEKALIVTHDVTRDKTYAEKLAEFKSSRSLCGATDGDSDSKDVEFTIRKDEETGGVDITIRDFVSHHEHGYDNIAGMTA